MRHKCGKIKLQIFIFETLQEHMVDGKTLGVASPWVMRMAVALESNNRNVIAPTELESRYVHLRMPCK